MASFEDLPLEIRRVIFKIAVKRAFRERLQRLDKLIRFKSHEFHPSWSGWVCEIKRQSHWNFNYYIVDERSISYCTEGLCEHGVQYYTTCYWDVEASRWIITDMRHYGCY